MERRQQGTRTKGWVVGRAAGAPVVVSPGWLLAATLLTLLFAPTVRSLVPTAGLGSYVIAAAFVVLLFGSVFLHELAHALVARRRGVAVTELAVTLLGGHTQMGGAAPTPATSALVAVVGPVVNIGLAVVAWFAAQLLTPGGVPWLLLSAAALANGFVGLFNLVPGLPLDGGRVLEALVWRVTGDRLRGTSVAGWVGRAVAVGVLAWTLLRPLLRGEPADLGGVLWGALVGAFLWSGAGQAVRAARSEQRVHSLVVEDLMVPAAAVPARGTLADLDAALALADPPVQDGVLVGVDGRPVGYVERSASAEVPAGRRAATPLSAVAVALPPGAVVHGGLRGSAAVEAVAAVARLTAVMVVVDDRGRVRGLLRSQDVVQALRAPS